MSEVSSGPAKIKEDSVKKQKRKELDAVYDKVDKLLDPIFEELKKLEYHDKHIL